MQGSVVTNMGFITYIFTLINVNKLYYYECAKPIIIAFYIQFISIMIITIFTRIYNRAIICLS